MPRKERPGPRRPTIADIAARAGVSKVSVSYALNGHRGLSESTRLRILAIADEIGWQPNRAARALSASRAGACGLAFARPARTLAYEPFFSKLLSGIEAELSAHEIGLMLQIVEDIEAEKGALRRWWAVHQVDGVLLVDLRVKDPRIEVVEELHLPAVIVGGPGATRGVPFLPGNDMSGVQVIVEHLVSLGHRRIDRVAGSPSFASTQYRTRVLKQVLDRAHATGRVVATDYTSAAGAAATRRLLSGSSLPTAIIYDNDIMAVAGLGVAQEMGIAVPEALSVVSFDDSILCEVVRPALTACARDIEAFGAKAAHILIDLIDGAPVAEQSEEPSSLVIRASTGPPASWTR
ncbi:MAG TPA: LacI family DNA-binding transcriptional regulator [Acidimicrobiales bacterium]|nr:LacI family DNA-binding transcriptional regulator [Acidimicrobiales bacterium]